jgi:hypothetical protein
MFIPDFPPRIQGQKRFRIRNKDLSIFCPKKNLFLSSRNNDLGCSSRIPIRIQGSKKHRISDPQHCEYLVEVEIVLEWNARTVLLVIGPPDSTQHPGAVLRRETRIGCTIRGGTVNIDPLKGVLHEIFDFGFYSRISGQSGAAQWIKSPLCFWMLNNSVESYLSCSGTDYRSLLLCLH